jgi:hypothetical protein
MMILVEAFNHRPIAAWYNCDAKVNDKTFANQLLARLPQQGLLIFDLGLRWQIEEAFLFTKRLLGLAYLWVGG